MSLDNFWSLPGDQLHPTFDPPLFIEFSPYAKDSSAFRGKKYSIFLEDQFSLSLFKKKLSQEEVKIISIELKAYIKNHEGKKTSWNIHLTNQEILDLSRMFSTYAELGASLAGWW